MLNQQLLLVQFLLAEFGFRDFQELRRTFSDFELQADEADASVIGLALMARPTRKVAPARLQRYDENLMAHLAAMNRGRLQPISLKYYQYFSVLFTEYYLDHYLEDKADLLARLNRFRQQSSIAPMRKLPAYVESDLNKLAFWNATGSGKTFLLHLNIRQYQHYTKHYGVKVKNFILLTPSAELSQQHLTELAESNLPAAPYADDKDGPGIKVIEYSKIKHEKSGSGGVTIPVAEFEEQNALFVDEGHKGNKSEESVWRDLRNLISRQGFAFEYSATFGQLSDAGLMNEYAKCIAFDYSYGRFFADGYGKSYWIHNLSDNDLTEEQTKRQYLLQNLLVFVQQKLYYREQPEQMQTYRLENPLLIFVGSSVTPKATGTEKKENEEVISDVKTVLDFFNDFAENRDRYLVWIDELRQGRGLFPDDYRSRLDYLFEQCPTASAVYGMALQLALNAQSAEPLELYTLRNNNAEIALKLRGSDHYFGLIYIGDVSTFKSSIGSNYEIRRDVVNAQSLFSTLSDQSSNAINVLIGARKFIEGWNNFRVSAIGLINFGRAKGSQIIQLFGRGVRLRGKDGSLKRSWGQPDAPSMLHINETLSIFGLRADYMKRFNEDLHKEGISTQREPIEFPAVVTHDLAKLQLITLKRNESVPAFHTTAVFPLKEDINIPPIRLDIASKRFSAVGAPASGANASSVGNWGKPFTLTGLSGWVDWDSLYQQLLRLRREKQYHNLHIQRSTLPGLFDTLRHVVIADEELTIRTLNDIERLQKLVFQVVKKYVETFYKRRLQAYEGNHLEAAVLDETNSNLNGLTWTVEVKTTDASGNALIGIDKTLARLRGLLVKTYPQIMQTDTTLINAWADGHLYQPLLGDEDRQGSLTANGIPVIERITPKGLNVGELKFVEHLQTFTVNKTRLGYADYDFFLLRNLSRGRGFGFYFEASGGFYPDFMLWIKDSKSSKQYLSFIDPHGLRNEDKGWASEKIQLHQKLKELEGDLKNSDLSLNSFILDPNGDLNGAGLGRWERAGALPGESLHDYAARQHVYEIALSGGNAVGKNGYIDRIMTEILTL